MDPMDPKPAPPLEGANIVCIASANWEAELWTNSQHLMSRLARKNRVLFVESLGLRRPMARWRDLHRIGGRVRNWTRGVRRVSDSLYVYSPLVLPLYNRPWVRRLNYWILRTGLGRIARARGFRDPILWTFLPTSSDLVGHLGESLSIYHCVDEYGANPGVPAREIQEMERSLLGKSDLVFTTSKSLYEGKRRYNGNTFYLPNVADADHFMKAGEAETEVPEAILNLPRPVVGFVGALSDYKVDFQLLMHIARARPGWTLALVGPVWPGSKRDEVDALEAMPNVRFFGARPYEDLPGYLKGFDVCLIPFAVNETTVNVFPMKFHEFMATGKPVVVTDLPSLAEFREYCRTPSTPDGFVRALDESLAEGGRGAEERVAVARRNTWEVRLEQVAKIVGERDRLPCRPRWSAIPRGRVGIDARKAHDFGIGTYIRNLVTGLSRIDPDREYVVFQNSAETAEWGENILPVADDSPKYSLRELVSLPLQMQRHRIDLFHSPHYVLPVARPCRAVVTIHDLIHLFYPPSRAAGAYAKAMMIAATRSASRVITVSRASRDDIVRVLRVNPEKVHVICNAVSGRFHLRDRGEAREEVARTIGVEREFVLCVSNCLPHKNLDRLVHAFAGLRRRGFEGDLVLAGVGEGAAPDLVRAAADLGLGDHVRFPGFVSEEFLPVLYSGARLFVFPSLYEGFGLPPLEAMACGIPVVVSDTPAITEVVGEAGLRVDPRSVEAIESGMARLLEDRDLHDRYAREGRRRAAEFSWEETARRTLAVYREVIGHG
ncbi:MAG: glycosyltransferase [Candidatus Eisenbacteria bacterium]